MKTCACALLATVVVLISIVPASGYEFVFEVGKKYEFHYPDGIVFNCTILSQPDRYGWIRVVMAEASHRETYINISRAVYAVRIN